MTEVKEVFSAICKLLKKHQVDYLVVGGFAVIYHGFTRVTSDVDFWYKPTNDNYIKIINAFEELGIDVSQLREIIFDPKKAFLRIPLHGVAVEFLPALIGGVTFIEAKRNAVVARIEDSEVPILSYSDLMKIKRATNRQKDLFDINELERRKKLK